MSSPISAENSCSYFIQKLYDEPEIEYQNLNKAYDGLRENNFNEKYFGLEKKEIPDKINL